MLARLEGMDWSPRTGSPASRKEKDDCMSLALQAAQASIGILASAGRSLKKEAKAVRDPLLRYGLSLLARGYGEEEILAAFSQGGDPDMDEEDAKAFAKAKPLKLVVVKASVIGLCVLEHPYTSLLKSTALIGYAWTEKALEWISKQVQDRKRRRSRKTSIIVPGEFPELVERMERNPRAPGLALRALPRQTLLLALSGCPRACVDAMRKGLGPIGAAILEDEVEYLRERASVDAIVQAQKDITDMVEKLSDAGVLVIGEEAEFTPDAQFCQDLSKMIMAMGDEALKAVAAKVQAHDAALVSRALLYEAQTRFSKALKAPEAEAVAAEIEEAEAVSRLLVYKAGKAIARRVLASGRGKASPGDAALAYAKAVLSYKE